MLHTLSSSVRTWHTPRACQSMILLCSLFLLQDARIFLNYLSAAQTTLVWENTDVVMFLLWLGLSKRAACIKYENSGFRGCYFTRVLWINTISTDIFILNVSWRSLWRVLYTFGILKSWTFEKKGEKIEDKEIIFRWK